MSHDDERCATCGKCPFSSYTKAQHAARQMKRVRSDGKRVYTVYRCRFSSCPFFVVGTRDKLSTKWHRTRGHRPRNADGD